MSVAGRELMLGRIRRALGRGDGSEPGGSREAVARRLTMHARGVLPRRGQRPPAEQVALFRKMAEAAAASVEAIATLDAAPDAIAGFLARHNLPTRLRLAPAPLLQAIQWESRPTLSVETGAARPDDLTSVTEAFAGIAETGTLMLASGAESPSGLNFLPDNHIVLLRREAVVGLYEEAWDRLRARGPLPRTVNLVTGPSRTGDIEQKLQLGAHGPRRLHILLVG